MARVFGAMLIVMLMLATACGGDDDDDSGDGGSLPVFDGADRIAGRDFTEEEQDALGFEASDGETVVYTTDASVEDVSEFYSEGVTDDGWTVAQTMPFGDYFVAFLNNGNTVVLVTVITGEAAKADDSLLEFEDIDLDPDEIEDDETVIALARYTCEEDDVATCLGT